jgi:hypothetical protein
MAHIPVFPRSSYSASFVGELIVRKGRVIPKLVHLVSSDPMRLSLSWTPPVARRSRTRIHMTERLLHSELSVSKLFDKTSCGYNILHHA